MARKLKVYRGANHPHSAQQPTALKLGSSRTSTSAAEAR